MRVLSELKIKILRHIAKCKRRHEPAICSKFCSEDTAVYQIENALFWMVREGYIGWFGDNRKPLWYRATNKGRGYLKRLR